MRVEAGPEVVEIVRGVAASTGAVGEAVGLPPAAYTSPEFFAFEREAVFGRSWLYLCHESELVPPGAAVRATVLGEPLIATRTRDGSVHVMGAVCQHRGHTLVVDDVAERHIRCPYHAWTYALDGRLVGAPSMVPEWEVRQLRKDVRLPRVRSEVWHGLVLVTFDETAPPAAEALRSLEPVVAEHRMADLVHAHSLETGPLAYNWKNMLENALEEYHTMYVHAGLHDNAPPELVRHGEFAVGDAAVYRHAGLVVGGGEEVPGRPTFPVIEGMSERTRNDMVFFALPPSLFVVMYPHGIKTFRVLPRGAGEIEMRISFHYPRSTVEADGFAELLAAQVAFVELIDQPDVDTNLRVFEGLSSRFAPRGPLGPQERTLPQLYAWFADACTRALEE